MGLAVTVIHGFEAVELVVAVLLGAVGAIRGGDRVGQALSAKVVGVVVLDEVAALPLPLAVLPVIGVGERHDAAVAVERAVLRQVEGVVGVLVADAVETGVEELVAHHLVQPAEQVEVILHLPPLIVGARGEHGRDKIRSTSESIPSPKWNSVNLRAAIP